MSSLEELGETQRRRNQQWKHRNWTSEGEDSHRESLTTQVQIQFRTRIPARWQPGCRWGLSRVSSGTSDFHGTQRKSGTQHALLHVLKWLNCDGNIEEWIHTEEAFSFISLCAVKQTLIHQVSPEILRSPAEQSSQTNLQHRKCGVLAEQQLQRSISDTRLRSGTNTERRWAQLSITVLMQWKKTVRP